MEPDILLSSSHTDADASAGAPASTTAHSLGPSAGLILRQDAEAEALARLSQAYERVRECLHKSEPAGQGEGFDGSAGGAALACAQRMLRARSVMLQLQLPEADQAVSALAQAGHPSLASLEVSGSIKPMKLAPTVAYWANELARAVASTLGVHVQHTMRTLGVHYHRYLRYAGLASDVWLARECHLAAVAALVAEEQAQMQQSGERWSDRRQQSFRSAFVADVRAALQRADADLDRACGQSLTPELAMVAAKRRALSDRRTPP